LLATWAVAFVAALAPLSARVQDDGVSNEYRLKAAFVDKFPEFVEWPPAALGYHQPLGICVLNPNPFGKVLDALTADPSLAGRRMVVRRIDAGDGFDGCHVLFLPTNAPGREGTLRRVASLPVLTISEGQASSDRGAVIQLRIADRKVRFDINLAAARTAGLRLSAQLLRLATDVRGGGL